MLRRLWRWLKRLMSETWTPVAATPEIWTSVTPGSGEVTPPDETPDASAQYDLSAENKTGFLFFAGWL